MQNFFQIQILTHNVVSYSFDCLNAIFEFERDFDVFFFAVSDEYNALAERSQVPLSRKIYLH